MPHHDSIMFIKSIKLKNYCFAISVDMISIKSTSTLKQLTNSQSATDKQLCLQSKEKK